VEHGAFQERRRHPDRAVAAARLIPCFKGCSKFVGKKGAGMEGLGRVAMSAKKKAPRSGAQSLARPWMAGVTQRGRPGPPRGASSVRAHQGCQPGTGEGGAAATARARESRWRIRPTGFGVKQRRPGGLYDRGVGAAWDIGTQCPPLP